MQGLVIFLYQLLGIGVCCIVFGTVGLLSPNMSTVGEIVDVHEVYYNRCIADISYTDAYSTLKVASVDFECPVDIDHHNRRIPVMYNVLNSDTIRLGTPWIFYAQIVDLYKFGVLVSSFAVLGLNHLCRSACETL